MKHIKFLFVFLLGIMILSCSDDAEIKNNDLLEPSTSIDKRHRYNELFLNPCGDLELKIAVCQCDSGSDEIDITQAHVNDAIAEFNSLNLKLNLTVVECDEDIERDIVIHCGWFPHNDCVIGETIIMGGIPFIGTVIDPVDYFLQCCPDQSLTDEEGDCYMKGLIMHELMHAIGFDHTDDTTAPLIPGTLEEDPASMANAGSCDFTACEFSAGDIQALEILYGHCACPLEYFVSGPGDLCLTTGEETAIFCLGGEYVDDASITVIESDGISTSTIGNCIEVSFPSTGTYTIAFEVCNDLCGCITYNKTIEVFDGSCCSTCYCECTDDDGNPFREEIPCWDQTSCEDEFGGDLHDCKKVEEPVELGYTLTGDEEICLEDGYGTFCVNGLPAGTSTTWYIDGPNISDSEESPNNCLSFDLDEVGTYTITTKVCEGECCETLTHTIVVSDCDECYCECWQEVDRPFTHSDGKGGNSGENTVNQQNYVIVQVPIDCNEDCEEVYGGDPLFNCVKKRR